MIRSPQGKDRAGKLALVLMSVISCLAAGELLMRWLHPAAVAPDTTTRTEKAQLYGWAPEPGQRLTHVDPETGKTESSNTNSQGWRDVEHAFEKPRGRIRIVFLGDSFTYGTVPVSALYTRRVEAKLRERGQRDVEVISMGVGGWGPDQELEALKNEGLRYAPDLVVLQYCSNDLINLDPPPAVRGDMSLGLHKPFRYFLDDGKLVRIDRQSVETARSAGRLVSIHRPLRRSALFRTLTTLFQGPDDPPAVPDPRTDRITASNVVARFGIEEAEKPWQQVAWRLLEALLREMQSVSTTRGAGFLVCSETGEEGLRAHLLESRRLATEAGRDFVEVSGEKVRVDLQLPIRRLAEICERHGIPLIEPKRSYPRYRTDWHMNRIGNENMADDIVDFLESWPVYRELAARARPLPPRT